MARPPCASRHGGQAAPVYPGPPSSSRSGASKSARSTARGDTSAWCSRPSNITVNALAVPSSTRRANTSLSMSSHAVLAARSAGRRRAIPYLSLLVIWFGIDEEPKVYLLMIAAFPPVAVATATAVTGVNRQYVEAAQALGAGRGHVIASVVLPASAPEIITGVRLAVGIAYSSVVAAETVNGADGIGGMVLNAQRYNQTSVVVLGLFVIGITGLLIDSAIVVVQRVLSPWRGLV